MRWALAPLIVLAAAAACVSGGTGPATACSAGDTSCLQGTVTVAGFTAPPRQLEVSLFREFPSTGAVPVKTMPVGADGPWTFGDVDPWGHYFVELVAHFGPSQDVASIVGPLTVPSGGGPVATHLGPAQLTVLEQAASGMALQLQSATAYLFDPASGAPLQGATVSIAVGGTSVAMPWTSVPGGPNDGYYAAFSTAVPAQPTYTITSTAPGAGAPTAWQLAGSSATFAPSLSAPAAGATVPANQALTVTWPAQPMADEELVELYTQTNGAWSLAYTAPAPLDADATSATIPGSYVGPSGQSLLVNVVFVQASCPATADGCVVGEEVAPAQLTTQ